ncbi:hypothetical protein [Bacillus sp. jun1]|uniref:hypothetical protein n=1 Tax=Bacillus sp. jun1 TaxID=2922393 RepID=UPI003DA051F8
MSRGFFIHLRPVCVCRERMISPVPERFSKMLAPSVIPQASSVLLRKLNAQLQQDQAGNDQQKSGLFHVYVSSFVH